VGPGASVAGSEGSRAAEAGPQLSAPEAESQHRDPLSGGGGFREGHWAQVQVGDVLRVSCDEAVPCDMLILCSSDATGRVFVETANLDGETSLKARFAVAEGESLLRSAVLHGAEDEVKSRRTSMSLTPLRPGLSSNSGGATMPLSGARRAASEVVRPTEWKHGQERPSTDPHVGHQSLALGTLPDARTIPLPGTSSAGARMQANGLGDTFTEGPVLTSSRADAVDPLGGPRGPQLGVVVAEPPNRSISRVSLATGSSHAQSLCCCLHPPGGPFQPFSRLFRRGS